MTSCSPSYAINASRGLDLVLVCTHVARTRVHIAYYCTLSGTYLDTMHNITVLLQARRLDLNLVISQGRLKPMAACTYLSSHCAVYCADRQVCCC